jgi:acyl-CoA reductase-like NAD-dependent aldehyde dehydrogenase
MTNAVYDNKLFIGGTWQAASRKTAIDVRNPSDGSVLMQTADASADDAIAQVGCDARAPAFGDSQEML